jgi:hydrogenase maturation protease
MDIKNQKITLLGIGNILFRDEGVGVRVIEQLENLYAFPDCVSVVDGGVMGLGLLNILAETNHLIVVDAVKNRGKPGELYRLEGDAVPKRFLAKNSLHQIDFLETLTASQVIERLPETVILGVEPEDIETLGIELTPTIQEKVGALIDMVLRELDRLGVQYRYVGEEGHVSGHTCENCQD